MVLKTLTTPDYTDRLNSRVETCFQMKRWSLAMETHQSKSQSQSTTPSNLIRIRMISAVKCSVPSLLHKLITNSARPSNTNENAWSTWSRRRTTCSTLIFWACGISSRVASCPFREPLLSSCFHACSIRHSDGLWKTWRRSRKRRVQTQTSTTISTLLLSCQLMKSIDKICRVKCTTLYSALAIQV